MRIRFEDKGVSSTLQKLQDHLQTSKLLSSIENIALAAVQRNFVAGGRTKSGATGAWPGLAESTLLMRRGKSGARPLQDTRALMNGIHGEKSANKVQIATAGQPYDALHQFGGIVRPRVTMKMIGFMWGKYNETKADIFAAIASKAPGTKLNIKIPARPYLMLTDPDRREIHDFVLNFKPAGGSK